MLLAVGVALFGARVGVADNRLPPKTPALRNIVTLVWSLLTMNLECTRSFYDSSLCDPASGVGGGAGDTRIGGGDT